uniref:Uncharacterized protein n=1 Tax=Oryza punctata TaxID=4537 RepID=A0A0E0K8R4_ORYPU
MDTETASPGSVICGPFWSSHLRSEKGDVKRSNSSSQGQVKLGPITCKAKPNNMLMHACDWVANGKNTDAFTNIYAQVPG